MTKDWYAWHSDYDQPESALARRLAEVRQRVADALDVAPPGPLRALSLCAGQGRDLIPVLTDLKSPRIDAYFVYPEEMRNSKRVGVFRDFLVSELAATASQA